MLPPSCDGDSVEAELVHKGIGQLVGVILHKHELANVKFPACFLAGTMAICGAVRFVTWCSLGEHIYVVNTSSQLLILP